MDIKLRPIVASDEDSYVHMNYWNIPDPVGDLDEKVRKEFRGLISLPGINAMAALDESGEQMGYVVSAFLKPKFEQFLRTNEVPDIVPKLVSMDSVIGSDRELGRVNASGNLVSSLITYTYKHSLPLELEAQLKNVLMSCAVTHFSGFNLTEIMIEVHSDQAILELTNAGFKIINRYEKWWKEHEGTRETCPALLTITRQDAQRGVDFHILRMFVFAEPQYRFSYAERSLLEAAMMDLTDAEIADRLCISSDAVKGRWKSIYQRAPEILVEKKDSVMGSKRSNEKRRKVINYVKTRPQELKPYFPE